MIIDKNKIVRLGLESGDIGGVKGSGPAAWFCRHLIDPPTEMFHFFLIWMTTEDNQDRVILESQGEGTILETFLDLILHCLPGSGPIGQAVAIGRLSKYDGQELRFFRPRFIGRHDRRHAPIALTAYGQSSYAYEYITKLVVLSLIKWAKILLKERRFRRLKVIEVPFIQGKKALICTVAPNVGYFLGGDILLPVGVTPTPNAYELAFQEGILEEITETEIIIGI